MPYLNIATLGYGGGVPLADNGNTNFALFVTDEETDKHSYGYATDLLARHPFWLIDCGPETLHQLATRHPAPSNIIQNLQGILLTHCHGDHSGGLAALAWRAKFVEKVKSRLVVHRAYESILRNQLCELEYARPNVLGPGERYTIEDFFDVTWIEEKDSFFSFRLNEVSILAEFFEVNHNIRDFPSFGISLTHLKTMQKVIFSGDTAEPIFVDWDPSVEVVFHDCQFYSPEDQPLSEVVHCPFWALDKATPPEHRSKIVLAHTGTHPAERFLYKGYLWMDRDDIYSFEIKRQTP